MSEVQSSLKRILIDQDGVLADFEAGVLNEWRKRYPDRPFIPLDQRKTFYIREDYPKEFRADLEVIYTEAGFIRNLPAIPGAIEALQQMRELGHTIRICTSPLSQYQNCVEEKYAWVEHYLGKEWVKNLILAKDKTEIIGDFLIDDRPEVTGDLVPTWEHIVFNQPYNRQVQDKRRLVSWSDWQKLISEFV